LKGVQQVNRAPRGSLVDFTDIWIRWLEVDPMH
jgi:hypothetical protein